MSVIKPQESHPVDLLFDGCGSNLIAHPVVHQVEGVAVDLIAHHVVHQVDRQHQERRRAKLDI